MRTAARLSLLPLFLFCYVAGAAPAQERSAGAPHAACVAAPGPVDPGLLSRPTTLKSGIGRVSQKVTTKSPECQAFYDQGLAFLHSYVWIEAARAFRQALRHDSECAMAWMGLARAEQGLNRDDAAAEAIEKAKSLMAHVSERERRFIGLRAEQMEAQSSPTDQEKEKHEAYKKAIEKAIAVDPGDAELWLLRGNAEEAGPWGRGQFGGVGSIAYYEAALKRSPGNLAAYHYLIHSFENVGRHAEAAEHGRIYAAAAPNVAHAQHMYGHVLPRLGRWNEALEQLRKADAIEERYASEEKLRPGEDWHHLHNLQLLGYTYLRLARLKEAEETFRRAFDTPARFSRSGFQHANLAELLLLRGRTSEALAAARALSVRPPVSRAAGAAVEGEVLLALGRVEEARDAARRAAKSLEQAKRESPRDTRYLDLFVAPYVQQIDAELSLHGENAAAGEEVIRKVADALAANPRFDAWGEGLFRLERIAQEAKRAGRVALAADVHARMRRIDPEYVAGSTAVDISRQAAIRAR